MKIHVKNYKRSSELETKNYKKLGQSLHYPSLGSSEKNETSQEKYFLFSKMGRKTDKIFTTFKINLKQLTTRARTKQGGEQIKYSICISEDLENNTAVDTFYWQHQNLFTYLLGQKNLGEPFWDPLYKRPLFPAETLRQWGSLQPHPLQHLLLQDMGKKEKTIRHKKSLSERHPLFFQAA